MRAVVTKHNNISEVGGYILFEETLTFLSWQSWKQSYIMVLNVWCTSTVLYLSWYFVTHKKSHNIFHTNYSFENISFQYFFYIFFLKTISKKISLSFKIIYCPNWPNYLVLNRCDITIHYSISVLARIRWRESVGYLRRVQYIKVKDLFNQKDYCSSLWLITTKFDNFYEVKREKKNKKQFLNLEVRVEWQESLVDQHCSIEN